MSRWGLGQEDGPDVLFSVLFSSILQIFNNPLLNLLINIKKITEQSKLIIYLRGVSFIYVSRASLYVGQHIQIGGEQRAKIKASGKVEKLNQKENIRK